MTETNPKIKIDIIRTEDLKDWLDLDSLWATKTKEDGEIIDITRISPEWIAKHVK